MDSYETLLEKGQYELIIKATHGLKEPEALFYRIIAFSSILKLKYRYEVGHIASYWLLLIYFY